jgi:hypothetical protein
LRAYDRQPSSPEGIFQNVPVKLRGKTILIDIEVIIAPLDYNILFGRSYMYAMKAVTSSMFRTMMFPHNEKIITIDQVSHYEPNPSSNIENITLRAYDRQPSSPEGIFQNVPVKLKGKTILIDIEVIIAPLDYNILFGRSYMYAMKAITSSMFRTMMFPHNGKIITIDQVSHYEPNPSSNIENILPFVHTNPDAYPLIEMGPIIFKDPSLLGTYHGAPSLINPSTQVCVVYPNRTTTDDTLPPTEASFIPDVPLVAKLLPQEYPGTSSTPPILDLPLPQGHIPVWETVPQAITQIPFFYPPPGVQDF